MKRSLAGFVVVLSVVCLAAIPAQKRSAPASGGGQVDRGRYLVENVAMCGECHSPRDSGGQPDHSRWLEGAPIWFSPVQSYSDWAYRAPSLAGLPSFTDDDMTMILEKGLQPSGRPIRPPMHVFHMSHEDTAAIVAYLRSLPPTTR